MLTLSATANVAQARRELGKAVDQLPFVTALALTSAVKAAQRIEVKALPSVFDNPTPFTLRGIAITPATKAMPTATVYVRPQQAEAGLLLQETGGVRSPKKRAIVMPAGARVNAFGNLPRNAVKRLMARPDVFAGTVRGIGGIWQRPKRGTRRDAYYKGGPGGGYGTKGALSSRAETKKLGFRTGLTLLIAFEDRTKYEPRFQFRARAEREIRATVAPAFRDAIAKAMRTAR